MISKDIPKNPLKFSIFASSPHKRWVVVAFISVFIGTGFDKFWVVIFKNLTDSIVAQPVNFNAIWFWTILFPVVYLGSQISWRMSGFSGMRWFMNLRTTIYESLYEYLSLHSKDYFNSRFAGALTNKISNAVEGTDELLEKILWRFTQLLFSIIFYAIIAAFSNIILGIIIVAWSAIFLAANYFMGMKLHPYSYNFSKSLSSLKGRIVDSITNISIVHENAYLKGEREYINKFVKRQYDTGLRSWWVSEWVLVVNGFMNLVFISAIMGFSIYLLQIGSISIGVIVMIITIIVGITNQFFAIGQEIRDSSRLYGQIKEGLDEILREHVVKDSSGAQALRIKNGEISIEEINFNYENTKVFENFSINIAAGQKVGFVGRSGAGKTTLVSLLLRHFDVQDGVIKIDGQDIKGITLESLRRAIGFVPQDTSLFHRTIRENISYSNPEATQEEVIAAAKSAQAHEFIETLPNGYDTLVGERGVKLSGGQRQRIAIARAFLKNAPILILDEATSSLDTESEQAIQGSLKKLIKKGTVIAIAHRLSTLKEMDRIVIISDGKIAEEGSPAELLKKQSGIFKGMWENQVKGFIVDE
jgi:ATP-binding cassette, subfamily B, bacterial